MVAVCNEKRRSLSELPRAVLVVRQESQTAAHHAHACIAVLRFLMKRKPSLQRSARLNRKKKNNKKKKKRYSDDAKARWEARGAAQYTPHVAQQRVWPAAKERRSHARAKLEAKAHQHAERRQEKFFSCLPRTTCPTYLASTSSSAASSAMGFVSCTMPAERKSSEPCAKGQ